VDIEDQDSCTHLVEDIQTHEVGIVVSSIGARFTLDSLVSQHDVRVGRFLSNMAYKADDQR
jgi:hypothetical protein